MLVTIITLYLTILIVIGFTSAKKTATFKDFFVAKKRGSIWTISGSLAATILGGSAVIGAVNDAPTMGWATSWYMISASLGLFALVPFVSKIYQTGKFTLPDMLGKMHGPIHQKISSYIIPVAWIGIVATQIIASGKLLQSFLSLDYSLGVIISGVVFIVYTIAGGQISILKTDFFQAILIIGGIIIIALFVYKSNIQSSWPQLSASWPTNPHFSTFDIIILLITYGTTFTTGPDIYSRIFSAKNIKTARISVIIVASLLIPIGFTLAYIGVFGSHTIAASNQGALLIEVCKTVLPNWAVAVASIALLSAVLSSADTTLLSASIIITGLVQKQHFGQRTLSITRVVIFVIGILSMGIALNFNSIIHTLLIALTVYAGAFTIPIIWGLLNIKTKSHYVTAAMIIGGTLSLSGRIISLMIHNNIGNIILILSFSISLLIMLSGIEKPSRQKDESVQNLN